LKKSLCVILCVSAVIAQFDWQENGVPVRQGVHIEWQRTGDVGNNGEMIFVWSDTRNGGRDVYAQKVDSDGNSLWDVHGTVVVSIPGRQEDPIAVSDEAGGVYVICGDDDGVNVVALHEFVVILRVHRDAGLLNGAFEYFGTIVTQPHQPCVRTEFQSRKMILQRNAAAADDPYSNGCHVKQALGQAAALATEITPAWSSGRCFWTTSRRPQ